MTKEEKVQKHCTELLNLIWACRDGKMYNYKQRSSRDIYQYIAAYTAYRDGLCDGDGMRWYSFCNSIWIRYEQENGALYSKPLTSRL